MAACRNIAIDLKRNQLDIELVQKRLVNVEITRGGAAAAPLYWIEATLTAPEGKAISALRAIKLDANGRGDYASSSDLDDQNRVLGISFTSASAGQTFKIMLNGRITDSSWNWDMSKAIYVGTDGELIQQPPSGAKFSLQVAVPFDDDGAQVRIMQPVMLDVV